MKDVVVNPNFPRTSDGRVYHLGLKYGEIANRILTVGDPARARGLSKFLDPLPNSNDILRVESERGFLTFTGAYKGVLLSIVAIGMGFANMDFLVREVRECTDGDVFVIRFGSCGCLTDLPVGSIAVPRASIAVTRNFDFDFASIPSATTSLGAYRISKPCDSAPRLHEILVGALNSALPEGAQAKIVGDCVNASADSFYSSQGRITSFEDHNDLLLLHLLSVVPDLTTLEMETFQLLHLAQSYNRRSIERTDSRSASSQQASTVPQIRPPAPGVPLLESFASATRVQSSGGAHTASGARPQARGLIFAAAAHMVFASRIVTDVFITPEEVAKTQEWAGRACLDALAAI